MTNEDLLVHIVQELDTITMRVADLSLQVTWQALEDDLRQALRENDLESVHVEFEPVVAMWDSPEGGKREGQELAVSITVEPDVPDWLRDRLHDICMESGIIERLDPADHVEKTVRRGDA